MLVKRKVKNIEDRGKQDEKGRLVRGKEIEPYVPASQNLVTKQFQNGSPIAATSC